MKENEIRPAKLRKKLEELFEEDTGNFLSLHSKNFVESECPACGLDNKEINFEKKGYFFKKCKACRTFYISPRPRESLLKTYYSSSKASKFWQDHMFPQSREARIKNIYRPRTDLVLDIVNKYGIGKDLLIDIGAGSGFFGQEVAKRNIFKKVILVEPGPIKIKNSNTIEVINDSFENIDTKLYPDVVTNFELIEHLLSPLCFLKRIYSLMKDDSYFILTTPNMEGFELLTVFDKSINVAGPDHLNYFNMESVKLLLERAGFRNIDLSTPGELDCDIVRNKSKEGILDLENNRFLRYLLIENPDKFIKPFQEFLKKNKLSSSMLITAKK